MRSSAPRDGGAKSLYKCQAREARHEELVSSQRCSRTISPADNNADVLRALATGILTSRLQPSPNPPDKPLSFTSDFLSHFLSSIRALAISTGCILAWAPFPSARLRLPRYSAPKVITGPRPRAPPPPPRGRCPHTTPRLAAHLKEIKRELMNSRLPRCQHEHSAFHQTMRKLLALLYNISLTGTTARDILYPFTLQTCTTL
jgi:hypothetical protein